VKDKKLVGIITRSDILDYVLSRSGKRMLPQGKQAKKVKSAKKRK
jgi:CBS domain-containing protein